MDFNPMVLTQKVSNFLGNCWHVVQCNFLIKSWLIKASISLFSISDPDSTVPTQL